MIDRFEPNERVYKMADNQAHPMVVLGIKHRRFNRDRYLVSKALKETYIEIVSAGELVKAPLLQGKSKPPVAAKPLSPVLGNVLRRLTER
jgi:hypothetical protein